MEKYSEIDWENAERVGAMIARAREVRDMTQADLLTALGRSPGSRLWVTEVESGHRTRWDIPTMLKPSEYVAIAAALSLDPVEVLMAAGVHESRWPKLSNMGSTGGSVQHIDATGLSDRQCRIVEELVRELRKVPDEDDDDGDGK